MIHHIFNAVSYFNGEEETLSHDRGMIIDLENGSIKHCLEIKDLVHNYTIIKHKDKDSNETEIVISSLDELNDDELLELRELYKYKEESMDSNEEDDDYANIYKSKFE